MDLVVSIVTEIFDYTSCRARQTLIVMTLLELEFDNLNRKLTEYNVRCLMSSIFMELFPLHGYLSF